MGDKRQISEAEKATILERHGRRCFVDGEPISEDDTLEFHHIIPFSVGGPTSLDNIASVCKRHHWTIGMMSLQEYRDKLELARFFEGGDSKYLDELIRFKKGRCGEKLTYEVKNNVITLYYLNSPQNYNLCECPTTNLKYFYGTIPIEYLDNDKELQPRALREASVWSLFGVYIGTFKLIHKYPFNLQNRKARHSPII
jgi:hypothetical protein